MKLRPVSHRMLTLAALAVAMGGIQTACSQAAAPAVAQKKDRAMTLSKKCANDNLHRTKCMIELLLEDVAATYKQTGGGGISGIKAISSTSYQISLPQEERVDMFTYEFDVKPDGTVTLKSKKPSTQSF